MNTTQNLKSCQTTNTADFKLKNVKKVLLKGSSFRPERRTEIHSSYKDGSLETLNIK